MNIKTFLKRIALTGRVDIFVQHSAVLAKKKYLLIYQIQYERSKLKFSSNSLKVKFKYDTALSTFRISTVFAHKRKQIHKYKTQLLKKLCKNSNLKS